MSQTQTNALTTTQTRHRAHALRPHRPSLILENPATGDRIAFDEHAQQATGQLHARVVLAPNGPEVPLHIHPHQDERYVVIAGTVLVRIDGALRRISSGHALEIPRGTPHAIWNAEGEEALVVWQQRPALRATELAERLFALAIDEGRPGGWPRRALSLAIVLDEFGDELRLVRPIGWWTRLVARAMAPLARRLGYGQGPRALRALREVGHQLDLTGEHRVPHSASAA